MRRVKHGGLTAVQLELAARAGGLLAGQQSAQCCKCGQRVQAQSTDGPCCDAPSYAAQAHIFNTKMAKLLPCPSTPQQLGQRVPEVAQGAGAHAGAVRELP